MTARLGKKSVGSVVKDGEQLFVLVPINAVLEAEVEISPADLGELRVGDPVRIKVDAFPFQSGHNGPAYVIHFFAGAMELQIRHGASRVTNWFTVHATDDCQQRLGLGVVAALRGRRLVGAAHMGKYGRQQGWLGRL